MSSYSDSFRRLPLQVVLLGVVAIAALLYACWGGLSDVVNRWEKQEEYSHGYFIPLLSAWFLWSRKDALKASVGAGQWQAVPLILLGIALLLLGELSAIFVLIQISFLLMLASLVLAYGGSSLLRVAALPVFFLIFAIPLPYFVDAQFSWQLQMISSKLGVAFLRLVGTSVFLEGNVIDLGVYKLQVVEACSGLRYLYPLLSIGFLVGYMYQGGLKQRIALFVSTIPITVVMNSLRIAIVGLLVNQWGSNQADGFLHYFEGWIVFMACLAILLGEVWVFERFGRKRGLRDVIDLPLIEPVQPKNLHKVMNFPFLVSVILLLLASVFVTYVSGREEVSPQRMPLTTFPTSFDGWVARESALSREVEKTLGLDDYVLADYVHPDAGLVNFYVAYYGSQRKGVSPHSPQVCMPGGGWEIISLDKVTVDVADRSPVEVNRTIIERNGQRQIVYYWFMERGKPVANEYLKKWYLLYDAIMINRTDGALVRITAPVVQGEINEADERIKRFMQVSVTKFGKYLPE